VSPSQIFSSSAIYGWKFTGSESSLVIQGPQLALHNSLAEGQKKGLCPHLRLHHGSPENARFDPVYARQHSGAFSSHYDAASDYP